MIAILTRWFQAWTLEKARSRRENKQQHDKLMATLTDLTNALNAAVVVGNTIADAGKSVAVAIDNAVAKGIGGTAPDVQPQVDTVNALVTVLSDAATSISTAKDKLVAATPA